MINKVPNFTVKVVIYRGVDECKLDSNVPLKWPSNEMAD